MRLVTKFFVLLLLGLPFLPSRTSAQSDCSRHKLEIGVGTFSLSPLMQAYPSASVSVKRKFDKNVFRSGINFSLPPYGKYYGYLVNAGYERVLLGKRFQIFAGGDITFHKYGHMQGLSWRSYSSYGIGPVLGMEYYVTRRFFLQTEAACAFGPVRNMYNTGFDRGVSITVHRWLSLHAGIVLFQD